MKIGIDARFYNESGVGRYLRNLISNLQILDKKNKYFIFLLAKDYEQFKESRNFQKVLAPFSWYGFAEQFNLPKLLTRYQLDLVHFPHFNVPIFYTGKFVVTIHDLIHQHQVMKRASTLNSFTFKIKQIGYKRVFKNAVLKSQKILVPSESVQRLLIKEWNVGQDKIVITPEAVDKKILKMANKMNKFDMEKILNKFNIEGKYLFYVGNAHPHKNIEGLINVFYKLIKKYSDLKLVLSGYDHYFWERIKEQFQDPKIYYTGFISDEELVALYKGAESFVMPSYEEGFGIPILEAFSCGCPVVSSDAASLSEIGGDAAIYFDPQNQEDMIDKISNILNNQNLKRQLIKKGKLRYKQFSWEKLAKQTLEVYCACG